MARSPKSPHSRLVTPTKCPTCSSTSRTDQKGRYRTFSKEPRSCPCGTETVTIPGPFTWIEDAGTKAQRILGTGDFLTHIFGTGTHAITVQVEDSRGAISRKEFALDVVDTHIDGIGWPQAFIHAFDGNEVNLPPPLAYDLCADSVDIRRNGPEPDAFPLPTDRDSRSPVEPRVWRSVERSWGCARTRIPSTAPSESSAPKETYPRFQRGRTENP